MKSSRKEIVIVIPLEKTTIVVIEETSLQKMRRIHYVRDRHLYLESSYFLLERRHRSLRKSSWFHHNLIHSADCVLQYIQGHKFCFCRILQYFWILCVTNFLWDLFCNIFEWSTHEIPFGVWNHVRYSQFLSGYDFLHRSYNESGEIGKRCYSSNEFDYRERSKNESVFLFTNKETKDKMMWDVPFLYVTLLWSCYRTSKNMRDKKLSYGDRMNLFHLIVSLTRYFAATFHETNEE